MRLGLLTTSVSRDAGGLLDAMRHVALAVHEPPTLDVQVIGLQDRFTAADRPSWGPLPVAAFPTLGPDAFGYAPRMAAALRAACLDVLHVHGLWMYPSVASLDWARRRRGRRLLISPHGMLDRWALNNGRWKKRLAAFAFEDAHLRRADCLHALTLAELAAIRDLGLRNPVCVVPNAVNLPPLAELPAPRWRAALPDDARVLLYLGRLHAKKGLSPLLDAWRSVEASSAGAGKAWHLVIAGWDQMGCEADLRAKVAELRLARVHFVGPQFDADKAASYGAADAFVLPSFSEGLPMVVLEAWSHGLPVLMTPECNLPEGFAADAALKLAHGPAGFGPALDALFTTSGAERRAMGRRGQALVQQRFSSRAVSEEMRAVYRWLAGGGDRPASVH